MNTDLARRGSPSEPLSEGTGEEAMNSVVDMRISQKYNARSLRRRVANGLPAGLYP